MTNETPRVATRNRDTQETKIALRINIDGDGVHAINTGIPFFDHMLNQLAKHGNIDIDLTCDGDLSVDTHHTIEDCAIALGEAFREALGNKAGVRRFASGLYPLDEALVEVALDLSGRAFCVFDVPMPEVLPLGNPPFDPQLVEHFWQSFSNAAAITLHIRLKTGRNVHHIIEACFKGVARCIRDAVRIEDDKIPSTKGVL